MSGDISGGRSGARALLEPFSNRGVTLLVVGQALSTYGDLLFLVTFPFLVFQAGGGVGELTAALLTAGLARLAGAPLGGFLTDRWNARRVMIVADTCRMVTMLGFAWTVAGTGPSLTAILVTAVLLGACEGLFLPAFGAMLPSIVEPRHLRRSNAVGEAGYRVAAILGQLTAGLLLAMASAPVLLCANAATFAASLATLVLIPGRLPRDRQVGPLAAESSDGQRSSFLRSPLFITLVVLTGSIVFTANGLSSVGLPVLADTLSVNGPQTLGLLLAGGAVGRLIGCGAVGMLQSRHDGLIAVGLLVVHGLGFLAISLTGNIAALVLLMVVVGLADGMLGVLAVVLLQSRCPAGILGRATSIIVMARHGLVPFAVLGTGLLVATIGTSAAFAVGGTVTLFVAAFALSQRHVRTA